MDSQNSKDTSKESEKTNSYTNISDLTNTFSIDDTITIDMSQFYSGSTILGSGGGGSGSYTISSSYINNPSPSGLSVTGNLEIGGELSIKGRNITEMIDSIEKRLAILVPDPEKLEQFEALKKAYNHYKVLEALCQTSPKTDKDT